MTVYNLQVNQPTVERVNADGREYLSFPVVPLREMVYDYPKEGTREYLSADNIAESVEAWAGTPVTAIHPPDRGDGQTARNPESYLSENIGEAHEPELTDDGTGFRTNAFIDVEKARDVGGVAETVVDMLEAGEELAVSPGYTTYGDTRVNGTFDGEHYNVEQGIPIPDHIAIFPPDKFHARCTPEDGCAAPRVNAMDDATGQTMTNSPFPSGEEPDVDDSDRRKLGSIVLNALGITSDDCGDECDCDDCSHDHDEMNTNSGGDSPTDGADDDDVDSSADDDDDEVESTDEDDTTDDTGGEETMTDNERIQRLASELDAFDVDDLEGMSDDQLDALDASTEEQTDNNTDDSDETETETTETTVSPDEMDEQDVAELKANYAELESEYSDLREKVNAMADEKEQIEAERQADVICNAIDIERDTVLKMGEDARNDLFEKHSGGQSADDVKTNYGAIPGGVDRTPEPSDDEVSEYPAAGRAAYEQRNAESGD